MTTTSRLLYKPVFFIFLFVMIGSGCVVIKMWNLGGSSGSGYNHNIHIEDAGLSCTDCHETAETASQPGMPDKSICEDCHDPEDEDDVAFNTYWKGEEAPFLHVSKLDDEKVPFNHKFHYDKGISCQDCHGDVENTKRVDQSFAVPMDSCIACHTKKAPDKLDCVTCHTTIEEGYKPESHYKSWTRLHGQQARGNHRGGALQARCDSCHQEDWCASCHQNEKPKNHTGFWRQRGHGLAANINRSTCQTCHTSDTCNQCHNDTAPRNHKAGWDGPNERHCVSCHLPLNNKIDNCAVCHEGTSSHDEAPALPAGVPAHDSATADCLSCHKSGGSARKVSHPFTGNGAYCRQCHK